MQHAPEITVYSAGAGDAGRAGDGSSAGTGVRAENMYNDENGHINNHDIR